MATKKKEKINASHISKLKNKVWKMLSPMTQQERTKYVSAAGWGRLDLEQTEGSYYYKHYLKDKGNSRKISDWEILKIALELKILKKPVCPSCGGDMIATQAADVAYRVESISKKGEVSFTLYSHEAKHKAKTSHSARCSKCGKVRIIQAKNAIFPTVALEAIVKEGGKIKGKGRKRNG